LYNKLSSAKLQVMDHLCSKNTILSKHLLFSLFRSNYPKMLIETTLFLSLSKQIRLWFHQSRSRNFW